MPTRVLLARMSVCLQTMSGHSVSMPGFDSSLGTMGNRRIVRAAACNDPDTREATVFKIHQAIEIPTMDHNLLCPMQIRHNDVMMDECPKHLATDPMSNHNAATTHNGDESHVIPLSLRGVTLHFPTKKPAQEECENNRSCDLTSHQPEWDPHSTAFAEQWEAMADSSG